MTSDIQSEGDNNYNASKSKSVSDLELDIQRKCVKKKVYRKRKGETRKLNLKLEIPKVKCEEDKGSKKTGSEIHVKGKLSPTTTCPNIKDMIKERAANKQDDTEVEVVITCDDQQLMKKGN